MEVCAPVDKMHLEAAFCHLRVVSWVSGVSPVGIVLGGSLSHLAQ